MYPRWFRSEYLLIKYCDDVKSPLIPQPNTEIEEYAKVLVGPSFAKENMTHPFKIKTGGLSSFKK